MATEASDSKEVQVAGVKLHEPLLSRNEDENSEDSSNNPAHRAAHLVSFILRRSLSSPPEGLLTRLGFLCVRALWMNERASLARLVQLEALVADRHAEERRGLRALAREQRRFERERRRLEEKREALNAYHNVLNSTGERGGEDNEDDEYDEDYEDDDIEDDDDDDEDENEEEKRAAFNAINKVLEDDEDDDSE